MDTQYYIVATRSLALIRSTVYNTCHVECRDVDIYHVSQNINNFNNILPLKMLAALLDVPKCKITSRRKNFEF